MPKKLAVIGAGMMGSGIAAVSSLAGVDTVLVDTSPDRVAEGLKKSAACIREICDNGLTSPQNAHAALGLLSAGQTLEQALDGASMVIEAIHENLSAKQELFGRLDALLPPCVPILSNTSGLRITDIAANAAHHPERTMTAHFWLPAHLVPLVEVVMWEKTDENMAIAVKAELDLWGKAPVLVRRDLPGQLANRILQAIIREAVNIVKIGLASAEDVDTAVKLGMGVRFPAWGPLEHIDAVGLELALSVQETVLPGLSKEDGNEYLRGLIEDGKLGYNNMQGLYDWKQRDMAELVEKRNAFIIHALGKLRS